MNSMRILVLATAALGVALAANAEERAAEVHYLQLPRTMVIAGVNLRAAIYTVQWELQGTRATVTFARKGRVVATIQGESATFNRSVASDTLYFSKGPDGSLALNGLGFASTNKGILFPVVRSHRQPAGNTSAGNSLFEQDWPNAAPPVPRVYR
jgi:hypothetical protein